MARIAASSRAMAHSDNDLVERHRRGDPQAFEELYVKFSSLVYNLSLRLSGDPEEAADLSQETFLKIHRHLDGFRGRSSLKTWIYSVTLNCCRSRFRREAAKKKVLVDARQPDQVENLPDPDRNPEDKALSKSVVGRVAIALCQIRSPYREAVVLRDIEGLSYREIAQVLNVRTGTVRSRIARGRDRLRILLEADEK